MTIVDTFIDPNITDSQLIVFGLTLPLAQEEMLVMMNSKVAETQNLRYQLNHETHRPYVRLYEAAFPDHNFDKVTQIVSKHCSQAIPISFHWAEVEMTQKIILLWGQIDEQLREFQLELVEQLNPLREGYLKHEYQHPASHYSPTELQSIQKWGWPWLEEYEPFVIVAQPQTSFHLEQFDLEWDFKQCQSSSLILSPKQVSGHLHQTQFFDLAGI